MQGNKVSFALLYSKGLMLSLMTKKFLSNRSTTYLYMKVYLWCTYTQALSTKTGCPAEGSFETESGERGCLSMYRQNGDYTSIMYAKVQQLF